MSRKRIKLGALTHMPVLIAITRIKGRVIRM